MKKRRGYTLWELLVVLFSLTVVFGVAAVVFVIIHFIIKFW